MQRRLRHACVALVLAMMLPLSGVAWGAAGAPVVMGTANQAGSTSTALTAGSAAPAFDLRQTGTGAALRAVAPATGADAVIVRALNRDRSALFAANAATTPGRGAAVTAVGGVNHGIVTTTTNRDKWAMRANHLGTSAGTGSAVSVSGGLNTGTITTTGNAARWGLSATNTAATAGDGAAILGSGNRNTGVIGRTAGAAASGVDGENSAGGIGVSGRSNAVGGTGVYGEASGPSGRAGHFNGNVVVQGSLGVSGATPFVRGSQVANAVAVPQNATTTIIEAAGNFSVSMRCPDNSYATGEVRLKNLSGDWMVVFSDTGGSNPTHHGDVGPDWEIVSPANPQAEAITYTLHGAKGPGTIWVTTVNRPYDCHAQAQAFIS